MMGGITLDIEYFYDYSFGDPTGRAQGIGYVQDLLARLQHQLITSSNFSVNSTIDNNAANFALNQPCYVHCTHDDVRIRSIRCCSMLVITNTCL